MRRALVACVLAATAAACLFPSLDGLSGDAGTIDAADVALDTKSDISVPDASDASDASTIVDAPAGFSCAQVDAKFCDDFDDDDAQTFSHWSSTSAHNGTFARVDSDASPPFDVRYDIYAWDGGAPYALFHRGFVDPLTSSATLSFDLRVDQYSPGVNDYFNTGDLQLTPSSNGTNLVFGIQKAVLQETVATDAGGFTYPQHPLTQLVQAGKWTHVDVAWTFAPGSSTVQVSLDKQVVLAPTQLDPRQTYSIPLLTMGATYAPSGAGHAAFEIDNVVFHFQ